MFYHLLKFFARLALKLYCRDIYTHQAALLRQEGPLFLAANHPNSFLDAVIIASVCKRKTFILVRGDVFSNKWANRILRKIYCLPIYRRSEGRNLMEQNENTFSESLDLLKKGYNVLIFAEGICENEWKLRSLGKGAARLAHRAWQTPEIPATFQVLPVGITYNNFDQIAKKVLLLVGAPLPNSPDAPYPRALYDFNVTLRERLAALIIRVPDRPEAIMRFPQLIENIHGKSPVSEQIKMVQEALDGDLPPRPTWGGTKHRHHWIETLLSPLVWAGWLINAPLYYPVRSLARRYTRGTVFYDSVLFGLLFFTYPLYITVVTCILVAVTGSWWWLALLVILPFMGRLANRYRRAKAYKR